MDEIFDHFPLFNYTLRHIELCNSVIYSEIKFSNSVAEEGVHTYSTTWRKLGEGWRWRGGGRGKGGGGGGGEWWR